MHLHQKHLAVSAIIVACLTGVTGCAAAAPAPVQAETSASPAEAIEPSPTPPATTPFTLADGTVVQIVEGEPLPEPVVQHITQAAAPLVAPLLVTDGAWPDERHAMYMAVLGHLNAMSATTGRKLAAVVPTSDLKSPTGISYGILAAGKDVGKSGFTLVKGDHAAAIEKAKKWAEVRPHYELLIF